VVVAVVSVQQFVHFGTTLLTLTYCQQHSQSWVKFHLVQHVNCTVNDLVTLSPVYNDLSPSGIVL